MPVIIINGNLFDTEANYICHQVNCLGKMGSGIAKQIRERYPKVFKSYLEYANPSMLGTPQFVECDNNKFIVNMFAQEKYGYDGKQ